MFIGKENPSASTLFCIRSPLKLLIHEEKSEVLVLSPQMYTDFKTNWIYNNRIFDNIYYDIQNILTHLTHKMTEKNAIIRYFAKTEITIGQYSLENFVQFM